MKNLKELSRFSNSGKTFFFNTGVAENGTEYLAINALYGHGNQQRLVLFPPHFLQFRKHLSSAIEALQEISFKDSLPAREMSLPETCPACGHGWKTYELVISTSSAWQIVCDACKAPIFSVEPSDG